VRIIDLIAKTIYYDFPNRLDRRLNIGDCTPTIGGCDGHPGSSHAGLRTMDVDYYTLGESNVTQYKPECAEKTRIWSDFYKLINFDWERNYIFWKRIKEAFPNAKVNTDKRILSYMKEKVRKKYGADSVHKLIRFVYGDGENQYNHHIHAHIYLGYFINWDVKF
jgi:hypothetical protein